MRRSRSPSARILGSFRLGKDGSRRKRRVGWILQFSFPCGNDTTRDVLDLSLWDGPVSHVRVRKPSGFSLGIEGSVCCTLYI